MKRTHTYREILRAARACCRLWAAPLRSARGYTLRQLLSDADQCGVVVLWGLWTDTDLDTIIQ